MTAVIVSVLCVVAAVHYVLTSDGFSVVDPENPAMAYVWVFVLIALDAVIPIFPGETTLNAAATVAAQGKLALWSHHRHGALGAIVGDSCLFWLARGVLRRGSRAQVTRAKANPRVRQAIELLDSSAAVLIIGRSLPARDAVRGQRDHGPLGHPLPALLPVVGGQRHALEHLHLRAGLPDRRGPG